jgi:hypothetical protein
MAVQLTSCSTGLDESVLQIKTKSVRCHTADSKPVKQEVNGTVILPPLVFRFLIQLNWDIASYKNNSLFSDARIQSAINNCLT